MAVMSVVVYTFIMLCTLAYTWLPMFFQNYFTCTIIKLLKIGYAEIIDIPISDEYNR